MMPMAPFAAAGSAKAIADMTAVNFFSSMVDGTNIMLKFDKKGRDNCMQLI